MDSLYRRLGVTNRCEACAAIYGSVALDRERLARAIESVEFWPWDTTEQPDGSFVSVLNAPRLAAAIADAYEAEARPGRPPLPSPDVLPFDGPDREPSTADSDAPR